MLELLNSNIETVEVYLKTIRKYIYIYILHIKLEDQIKHRRAIWLMAVRDYLITKAFYKKDAKILI